LRETGLLFFVSRPFALLTQDAKTLRKAKLLGYNLKAFTALLGDLRGFA